jgi:redoxin
MMGETLLSIVLAVQAAAAPAIADLDGQIRHPFAPARHATVLLFIATDCPISNNYAPEIERLCRAYALRGVDCLVLYEDAQVTRAAARAHRAAYGLAAFDAAIDAQRTIATAAAATITPEAAVVDRTGVVRYRGRVDDAYVDLNRRRAAPAVHDLSDALDAVLAGRAVARPAAPALGCYIAPPWK